VAMMSRARSRRGDGAARRKNRLKCSQIEIEL
jgi:hypothetical protein